MLLHYLGKADQAICVKINRKPEKPSTILSIVPWMKISRF